MQMHMNLLVNDSELALIAAALLTEYCRVSKEEGADSPKLARLKELSLKVAAKQEQADQTSSLAA